MRFEVALGVTLAVHGVLALGISRIASTPVHEITTIQVRQHDRKPPPPPKPAVEPPAAPVPAPAVAPPKPVAKPAIAKAPPTHASPAATPVSAAPPSFDVRLGGTGASLPAAPPPTPAPPEPKKLAVVAPVDACADPIVKPKPIKIVQPAFTQDAQDAGITGKVRVEISIGANGEITNVAVIDGLGHGLDEAAVEAARASSFSPATRCGEPVATKFVIGMRFQR